MPQTIREIMTPNPVTMRAEQTAADAARRMRDDQIGDVLVLENGSLCGIVTDRDIVVRAVAEARDPAQTKLAALCSRDIVAVAPEDSVDDVIRRMRDKAVRRVPVMDAGKPVGIVSLGDLAVSRDGSSLLGRISSAPPSR